MFRNNRHIRTHSSVLVERRNRHSPTNCISCICRVDFSLLFLLRRNVSVERNQKNFSNLEKNGKILHVAGNDKSSKLTVIMEITAEMHKQIKENKDRLFVGYKNCKVYDVIYVKPCYKCGRLGHNGQRCRNNPTCLKCTGTHLTEKCTTEKICCVNCSFSNNRFSNKYDTNHVTTDRQECKILNAKVNKVMNSTEYIIKPDLPRHLGKVDNFKKRTREATNSPSADQIQDISTKTIPTRNRVGSSSSLITQLGSIHASSTSSIMTRARLLSQQDLTRGQDGATNF